MRNLTDPDIDKFRLRTADILREFGDFGGGTCGVFVLPSPVSRRPLRVIASCGGGWDHVSVSTENRGRLKAGFRWHRTGTGAGVSGK